MAVIETTGLSKTYLSNFGKKRVEALAGIDLSVESGTIFSLLGQNGAGKTTMIKILLGITYPTSGSASIFDRSISDFTIKKRIGFLPENHKYPVYLNAEQVLQLFGRLSGLEDSFIRRKTDELLELVKLSKWKKTKIKAFSKGMLQRLGLAQALINEPDLLFLDEPTDGVDPIGRKEIRDILLNIKSQSKTIFLNSHLLSEVEMISDRVAILNNGRLIREGSVDELTSVKQEYIMQFETTTGEISIPRNLIANPDGTYSLNVEDISELNKIIDSLRERSILIKEIRPVKKSLEDMFISLIQNEQRGSDE